MTFPRTADGPMWKSDLTTRVEAKALRDRLRMRIDRSESGKVKHRSGGRCEVRVERGSLGPIQCMRRATQVHHLIGGHGKRARGPSLLADHKQHVCDECHRRITGDVGGKTLRLVQSGALPAWTDAYRRVA